MKNPIVMLVFLGLVLLAIVSPFSALAMLMILMFGTVLTWTVATLIRAATTSSSDS